MSFSTARRSALSILAAGLLAALTAAPASAQDVGKVTVTAGVDFTNAYMFRGIRQDDTKLITWPLLDVGLAVFSGDGALKSATVNAGTWNSLHSGNAGSKGPSGKLWYERDLYATVGLNFGGGVILGTTYTAYTSPNDMFSTVKEIAVKVGVDDSPLLGRGALKPYALVAFEMDTAPGLGQADAGAGAGKYLELGIAPSMALGSVTLGIPTKVGLSLGDYYEHPLTGQDSTFGFLSEGAMVTVPLPLPSSAGSWNIHGGVEYQVLGDTTKQINGGDRSKVIGTIGFGLAY